MQEPEELLTPAEVAAMFRVDPKTVARWETKGELSAIRTLGGHRRFKKSDIDHLLRLSSTTEVDAGEEEEA